jgi:hypothetical protein
METTNTVDAPVHYNPNQLVTYKVIDLDSPDQVAHYPTEKVTQIEWALEKARLAEKQLASLRLSAYNLEEKLSEWVEEDTSIEEIISDICGLFGFSPTKDIEFEGTISFSGIISVPLTDIADFDISTVQFEVDITSYDGDVEVQNVEVDNVIAL